MHSERLVEVLKDARKQLNLSREELAHRAGVSLRLVAEFERGQRPNVSLESALQLLSLAGVSIVARAPNGVSTEIRSASSSETARAARAAWRRKTWTGRHVPLHESGTPPGAARSRSKRISAVAEVSNTAYAVAAARKPRSKAKGAKRHAR